jgi:hypothetical protein
MIKVDAVAVLIESVGQHLQRSESGLRKVFNFHRLIAGTVADLRHPDLRCPLDPDQSVLLHPG